jgi:glycerol uptake facilitator-like aquaporin
MKFNLRPRVAAEFLGTGFLLMAIVGSGIMAERLAGGNLGLALLANSLATGASLVALILAFGTISGAHFNPAVTLSEAMLGGIAWREALAYVVAQAAGGLCGVGVAHLMFGLPFFFASHHVRSGGALLESEFVATFGLLVVIWGCSYGHPSATPYAVGAYITAAYWFTSSTSFANPAVTLARAATDTFAGIRPADAPAFIAAQLGGTLAASLCVRRLLPANQAKGTPAAVGEDSGRVV